VDVRHSRRSAAPAAAAPIDDCRGLRLVCVFQDPNHGGDTAWTGVEEGTYKANYRTRTTGTNVVNSTGLFVLVQQNGGNQACHVAPGGDIDLPSGINDNIGQITITNWNGNLPHC
jgi:hypothetical protein